MYLVVDRKFVIMMFVSLITNYIKITETGELRIRDIILDIIVEQI